jgi:SNF2 family DNA or RNA helicase
MVAVQPEPHETPAPPALVRLRGRVLGVQPRPDGTFGVTVGPGQQLYWFRSIEPIKLGARLELAGLPLASRPLPAGRVLTALDAAQAIVLPEDYPRRVVAPEWLARVRMAMRPDRPLYPYQEHGAAWVAQQLASGLGAILADDPGGGKSCQLIAALAATGMLPAIIVCPTSVKANWVREIGHARMVYNVVSWDHGDDDLAKAALADLLVINYEQLRRRERQLASFGARVIVFDEAQLLKEPKPTPAHRAAVATRLAHWIGRAVLLTGTPLENRPHEYWRLLHLVDPKNWTSYDEFTERYCHAPTNEEQAAMERPARSVVTSHGRADRLDELQALVAPVLLRRRRDEIQAELPGKTRTTIRVPLPAEFMADYKQADGQFAEWLAQHHGVRPASRAIALQKLTHLRHMAARGKTLRAVPAYLRAWFRPGQPAEPLLVFAHHLDVLDSVRKLAWQLGVRVTGIDSRDDSETRQKTCDLFNEGYADLFLAPITAAGLGLNLHVRCCHALFIERVWTPTRLTQAEDRLMRPGQLRPVKIMYLDAIGTVDEHIAHVLEAKQRLIARVVDDREERFQLVEDLMARLTPPATEPQIEPPAATEEPA